MTDFSDRDIDATMDQFEAAVSARPLDLPEVTLRRALLALDGSNQDRAVLDVGRAVAARLGSGLVLTYAYERPGADAEHDSYLVRQAEQLAAGGVDIEHARAEGGGRAFQQILSVAEAKACDFLVLPSPYLENIDDLGRASVGTTTDVLLHRRSCPLLIVRKPAANVRERLENIVVPLNLLARHAAEAAAWSLKLAPEDGLIHLLAIVDDDMLETMRHLVGQSFAADDMDEATLAGLGRPDMAGFVAAVQRRAAAADIDCRVSIRHGDVVPAVSEFANAEPCLLVVGCGKSSGSDSYQRALALIRESANPVLVV